MQKKVPYVAQLGNMDCSIACMTMLFRYYGLDVDIVDVGQVVHIGRDGVNLTQLKQATQKSIILRHFANCSLLFKSDKSIINPYSHKSA